MTRYGTGIVFFACFLFGAASADSIDAVATFNNIGVEYEFAAAPAPGTTVSMAIKAAGSLDPYIEIHPLSPVAGDRFAGSAFSLDPGTQYSIRLSSPAFGADQFVSVTTRPDLFPDATGSTYHVAPAGSDGNTGASAGQAFATVGHALSVAQAGDQVLLHGGRYYEGDLYAPRSGTATDPIVIRNAPGETPVLDGTDTAFSPTWTLHDAANNIYSTPTAQTPSRAYIDGGQLYHYGGLTDLTANTYGMTEAYTTDGADLYVRLPAGDVPANHALAIPRGSNGLTIENKSYIQVRGVEFDYYGYSSISPAVFIDGGDYNLIDGCTFHANELGIALKRAADFNTIQNNTITGALRPEWSYGSVSDTDYGEAGGIYVYGSTAASQGTVIRGNVITEMFDGVHLLSNNAAGPTNNLDFHGNLVMRITDDAIETDGSGSNIRIYGNRLSDFLVGVSVAPAHGGPLYIIRNVLDGWDNSVAPVYEGYPFKFNNASGLSTDWVYLYHNTAYTDAPGQPGFLFKGYSDWHNIVSLNNIYAGTVFALESWPSSAYDGEVAFDYDNLYTTHPTWFIRWAGTNYSTLAAFFAATGQEANGLALPPDFVDAAGGDLHLALWSALIDQGILIPGVNDGYFGAAPDIGAYEAYSLAAIPEPPAAVLLALGLACQCRRRRR